MEIIAIHELLWILGALLFPTTLLCLYIMVKMWLRMQQRKHPIHTALARLHVDYAHLTAAYQHRRRREMIARFISALYNGGVLLLMIIAYAVPVTLPVFGVGLIGSLMLGIGYGIFTAISTRCPVCYTYLKGGTLHDFFEFPTRCSACGADFL